MPNAFYRDFGTRTKVDVGASIIPPGEICAELQVGGVLACGCSPSNDIFGNCTVCANGSSFPNPDKTIAVLETSPPLNVTCELFESALALLSGEDDDECPVAAFLAAKSCGCTPAMSLPVTCGLCEDGSIPPRFLENVDSSHTCYGLAPDFAIKDTGLQNCTAIQTTGGVYCGCNNTKASQGATCRVCGGDMLLPNPGAIVVEGYMAETPCGRIEYFANAGVTDCSEGFTMTDTPASTSSPAPAESSPTASPVSGPPPTPSTSGAMALAVMVTTFLPMVFIGFGL